MLDVFELIQQLCPDGVEYRRLGDIGVFQNGKGISKSDLLDNGDIPVVHYGQIYTTYTHAFRETVSFVDKRTAVSVKAHHGDVVVCLTDTADLGFVGKAVAQICGVDVGISGDAGVLHLNPTQVDARYLSYVMATECFQVQKEKCKRGTTVMHLNVPMWKKIRVPVPPLSVQEEIVRILDTFDIYCNDMTAGLAGELEMRRKQFQYWREKLLTFDDSVERKTLGEVGVLIKGMSGVSSKWQDSGNCRFIDYKNVYDHRTVDVTDLPFATVKNRDRQTVLQFGDVLFTSASEVVDECAIASVIRDNIVDGIFLDDHLFGLRLDDWSKIDPVFLNYYCQTSFFRSSVCRVVRGVTRFYVGLNDFKKICIPLPSLSFQQEIVRILDTFQELERELERELELRKKQFEYYRDRLLTFPEKAVN